MRLDWVQLAQDRTQLVIMNTVNDPPGFTKGREFQGSATREGLST
jgi:hypothetical protein